jgi:hypothetical protein
MKIGIGFQILGFWDIEISKNPKISTSAIPK